MIENFFFQIIELIKKSDKLILKNRLTKIYVESVENLIIFCENCGIFPRNKTNLCINMFKNQHSIYWHDYCFS
jgi:hypothetical protein